VNPVHLVVLWHMHQPQYRDPATGRYILPWTRLHALKDYWGMVRVLEEFPQMHATINVVPSLAAQLEEYASGNFDEPWFSIAFTPADKLTNAEKSEILVRAFQVNHENLMNRWPRYTELFEWSQRSSRDQVVRTFGLRDWRDLQFLSQLCWMDEEYLAADPVVSRLSAKGADYTEADKQELKAKQIELLARVLPEYRKAQDSGQVEISTTPFYHPILPLVCDSDQGRVSNPYSPPLQPPFRRPEDAREQLDRARRYHEKLFGRPPVGLWPSEGSVSDQALAIAAQLGFRWFATDEGVLGRTLNIGFGRDSSGVPSNADRLYAPLRVKLKGTAITGFFRDHYLSDLVGFVYSRMDSVAAADDLYRRIRAVGERVQIGRPLTVSLILDGENAWEYYPGNGREFLRQFYRRISSDPEIHPMTVSEALSAAKQVPEVEKIFPGSWINANFDIWIGSKEDITAWELLRNARDFYQSALEKRNRGDHDAPSAERLAAAFDALLAAEGSDWCWWFGPEHSSANDAEFDAFFRKLLSEVYRQLGTEAPDALAESIKYQPERAEVLPPTGYLKVFPDGRETSYFEWLGAGFYSPEDRESSMHGRMRMLKEIRYGFSEERFFVRVDVLDGVFAKLEDAEFRLTLRGEEELRVVMRMEHGKLCGYLVESKDFSLLGPDDMVVLACDKILEVSVAKKLVPLKGRKSFSMVVALWEGGLPVDLLPKESWLEVELGPENFAWPVE
jgi:alpha-amylase/alpha-mannosidase (GH57 family)